MPASAEHYLSTGILQNTVLSTDTDSVMGTCLADAEAAGAKAVIDTDQVTDLLQLYSVFTDKAGTSVISV